MIFYFSGNPFIAAGSQYGYLQKEITFFKDLGVNYNRLIPYNSGSFRVNDRPELVSNLVQDCEKVQKQTNKKE